MIPGEILTLEGGIDLNVDRDAIALVVANSGDRPIQVGSHYHFYETNTALKFDRAAALGRRLDIPAGTAMRFEPGQTREVRLVAYAGTRTVIGFRGEVMGRIRRQPNEGEPRTAIGKRAKDGSNKRPSKTIAKKTARGKRP